MTQSQVWKRLKQAFSDLFPTGDIIRIESSTMSGIPDVNLCMDGIEIWLEIKTGYKRLTPLQSLWREKRKAAGGKVAILRVLPPTKTLPQRAELTLTKRETVLYKAPIDWEEILLDLVGRS